MPHSRIQAASRLHLGRNLFHAMAHNAATVTAVLCSASPSPSRQPHAAQRRLRAGLEGVGQGQGRPASWIEGKSGRALLGSCTSVLVVSAVLGTVYLLVHPIMANCSVKRRVWDLVANRLRHTKEGLHRDMIKALAVSRTGQVATASRDTTIRWGRGLRLHAWSQATPEVLPRYLPWWCFLTTAIKTYAPVT